MNAIPRYILMLKKLSFILLVFIGLQANAQFDCKIYPGDTTVCYGERIYLYAATSDTLTYSWEPTGETGQIIEVKVTDTVQYILNVYNHDSTFHCSDTVVVGPFPKVEIEFEQIGFSCPLAADSIVDSICENSTKLKAHVTGGFPPYHYQWSTDSYLGSDTLVFNTIDGINYDSTFIIARICLNSSYTLTVTDSVCIYRETYDIKPYDMPEIEISMSPDSLFATNPQATFSFENKSSDSIQIDPDVRWYFPDGEYSDLMEPTHAFAYKDTTTQAVKFVYMTTDGCIDTSFYDVKIYTFKPKIPNVFTPNGDGINDYFELSFLEKYLSLELSVFNRWGEMVFHDKKYSNNWDGGSLSDGVYFYVLKCEGYWKEEIYKGSVSIFGSRH
jgi:gliding motility-associated-like protein